MPSNIDTDATALDLISSTLVFIMTPGWLSSMAVWCDARMCSPLCCKASCPWELSPLFGYLGFQPGIWQRS